MADVCIGIGYTLSLMAVGTPGFDWDEASSAYLVRHGVKATAVKGQSEVARILPPSEEGIR